MRQYDLSALIGFACVLAVSTVVAFADTEERKLKKYKCSAAINMYDPPSISFESRHRPKNIEMTFNNAKLNMLCREELEDDE